MSSIARHPKSNTKSARSRAAAGFTLLELLVAMAISTLILTALALLFSSNSTNQRELEKINRMTENARFAMTSIANDMRHAGFIGEVNPQALQVVYTDLLPCATTAADMGWNLFPTAPSVTKNMPVAIKGFDSTGFSCMTNQRPSTPSFGVVHADLGSSVSAAARTSGDFYLSTSRCETDVNTLELLSSSDAVTMRTLGCTGLVSTVRRLSQRSYYLSSCSDCSGAGDGIVSLARVERIGGAFRVTTVAENIELMDIMYGVDTNQDGTVDEYVTASQVNGSPAARVWANVVTAQVTLLAKADEPTKNFADTRSYKVGTTTVAGSNYRRVLFSQTIKLSNVAARQEN